MAQPPPYTPITLFSEDEAAALAGRSTVRTASLDQEFENAEATLDAILANLALIQRDDGELADEVVKLHTLSSAVRAVLSASGVNPRGDWLTATVYAAKDLVTETTGTYLCVEAHTSGVFATDLAADKWMLIFDTAAFVATGVAFTPTGTVAAGNVQAAIAEVAVEALQKADNLSDLVSAPTALVNLGLPAVVAGQVGQILTTNPAAADALIWTDYTREPKNVNPNLRIDQINEGALYTSSTGANVQGPDGWTLRADGAGVFKVRVIADPDNAARNVMEITCTTADASIAAVDKYHVFTSVEGYDSADLLVGTSSASGITLKFQSDFSVTGTYGIAIQNSAANRRYIGTFTQAVANARENQIITLTLDTSGTWLYTNGVGLTAHLTLAAGTSFQAAAGSWAAGAELTTSAQTNFMSSTSNIGYISRFHIIPGGVSLAYHKQDIVRELAKARRYLEVFHDSDDGDGAIATGYGVDTTNGNFQIQFAHKRASPTVSVSNNAHFLIGAGAGSAASTVMSALRQSRNSVMLSATVGSASWAAGDGLGLFYNSTAARIFINSRLS